MSVAKTSAIDLLSRLVAFDTTSHKSNIALISFVADYLRDHGVASSLVKNADGSKANLFASIGPSGAGGGIALSGHTDVVPVTGQAWHSDPFILTERDGKLYGRGTSDMKGFLACVLAAVPGFAAQPLKTPIHIVFSYDEEIGCIGVRPMLAEFGERLPKPAMVIVGEPTSMTVVDAHKGPVRWLVEVTGRAAHSSMAPLGVNAISYAARILNELLAIESELKNAPINTRFDPPYVTLQTTRIDGGMATNIVPPHCSFMFDVRALPDFDVATIEQRLRRFIEATCLPEMRGIAPEADIRISRANHVPPFSSAAHSTVVALALQLARQNETFAVSYATEAGLFQDAGTPAVVCGPGDIAQAHTANEWIEVTQLQACSQFLERLGDWAAETVCPQSNS